jgi:hypothetical protein
MPELIQVLFVHLLILLSGILLIPMRTLNFSSEAEDELSPSFKVRDLVLFIVVRVLLGAINWLVFQIVSTPYVITDALTEQQRLLAFAFCIGLSLTLIFLFSQKMDTSYAIYALYAILPMLMAAPLLFQVSTRPLACLIICSYFMFFISNIHLFLNIGLFNMSITTMLVISLPCTTLGTWIVETALTRPPLHSFITEEINFNQIVLALALIYAIIMVATFLLVMLVSNIQSKKKAIPSDTLARLAKKHQLTSRETEVLILWQKGIVVHI